MPATQLVHKQKFVTGLAPRTPSSSTPAYVSLKNANHLTVIITALNATTVTGSAITLKQATAVAGTGEKALSFSKAWRNVDTAAADGLTEFAVSNDTFTTDATNSKALKYVIEVEAESLDLANGFNAVRVGTGNATATVLSVEYVLSGLRYTGNVSNQPSAIVD